ncbi:MAG: PRD domain-containing protein [Erysipelotrichaceae bacterium]|nr:PRD domain-containing protein [Erysipelotrichaceae bacterium]MDY5253027.1 PRD domain-containing protein [Erysipelotrichaceae bacterium]
MKVKKILNNNVVIATDDRLKEYVVVSLGIAYNTKIGQDIPEDKIERIFTSDQEKNQLTNLVEAIPQQYFNLAGEIIEYVEQMLGKKLGNAIYITLTDHINFIKERVEKGILPENSLKWEIRQYYPKEFHISSKVVELLEDEFECELNDDEIASIAMHIINAEIDNGSMKKSSKEIQLIDEVMKILRYQAQIVDNLNDLNYQRLITHVRFFCQRVLANNQLKEDNPLFQMVKQAYKESYEIAKKIKAYIENELDCEVSDDELTYLIIHIERTLKRK